MQLGRIDLVGRTIDARLAGGATGVQGVSFEASTTAVVTTRWRFVPNR